MAIHSRVTPVLATMAALALGSTSVVRAQDTSATTRSDTAGYQGYQADSSQAGQPNAQSDTSGYNGAATDTALKAKPGVQTGPAAGDSGKTAQKAGNAGVADTVACKDGSNAANASNACAQHGGIDWTATQASMKARGQTTGYVADSTAADTTGAATDTSQASKNGAGGYRYNGAPSDTALRAKPGTQTGPDTGAAGKSDTSSSR